ncbi:MAG: helix-turn-helix domain-containing protein [Oscillospiraceae bacterium]|nr:helix-turn-helix domain-containing protein [Oscillospiraceae bacterium]
MKGIFEKKDYFVLHGLQVNGFRGYPPMFHTHGELIYVVKGSVNICVDGDSHTLTEGELSVVFPYLTHTYEDSPEAEVIILLFDPHATAFDNTFLTKKPVRYYADGKEFHRILSRAVTLLHNGKHKTAMGYVNAVIGEFLEVSPLEDSDHTSDDAVTRILTYCAEHFAESITIKSVAEALYLSPGYVSKIFSQKLKYGFREYINALRIEMAKSLLRNADKRITDIMLSCGFSNQSSFNRVFREICGVSPRAYRTTALR